MFNLTIKLRLILTMVLMGVILVIVASLGIIGGQRSSDAVEEIFTNQLPSAMAIADSQTNTLRARTALDRVVMHPDAPNAKETIQRALGFLTASDRAWAKYRALPADADEKLLSDAVAVKRDAFVNDAVQPLLAALQADKNSEADAIIMGKLPKLYSAYSEKSDELIAFQSKAAESQNIAIQKMVTTFRYMTFGGLLIGLFLVIVSSFLLLRAITNPLAKMRQHFDAIADGDLTEPVIPSSSDEMGQLMVGLEKMRSSLVQTVTRVRKGSSSIATATDEIAKGNLDLSGRTEQQAANLEETASSMEQLTATVKQNAENARQANHLSIAASEVAVRGGNLVESVVLTMDSIKESSSKIVDIIGVIDGIAFQTNILALNAAVEAARAGEQGRGFAVVASEVRALAQRSASAAKEIKLLIDTSVEKVDVGSKLVDDAGKTMHDIVESIKRVTNIMSEITTASIEQSEGINQINTAVIRMDEATQQNAALVEQAAAAAGSTQDQAQLLMEAVSVFKLKEQTESQSRTLKLAA